MILLVVGILLLAALGPTAAEEACLTEPCPCVTQGADGTTEEIACPQSTDVVDRPRGRVPSVSANPPCAVAIVPDGRRAITVLSLVVPFVAWLVLDWLVRRA
jgi:hypothetical protein